MVYYVTGIICGEMSAKAVAQSYWTKELEEELEELGIREKWLFTTNAADRPFSGNEEEAMEFVEKTGLKNCTTMIATISARKRVSSHSKGIVQLSENFLTCYHAVILREDVVKCIVQDNFLKSLKFAATVLKCNGEWGCTGIFTHRFVLNIVCDDYIVCNCGSLVIHGLNSWLISHSLFFQIVESYMLPMAIGSCAIRIVCGRFQ
jgi:hypothetical protein